MLYVDHRDGALPGNPSYEIPGPLLFLNEDTLMRRNEGRTQIWVPMQNLGGETWEELFLSLETCLYIPVEGTRALVYRNLSVLGGGTLDRPSVCRQLDVGVLYGVPHLEGWQTFESLEAWWATLDRARHDRALAEAFPRYADLLRP